MKGAYVITEPCLYVCTEPRIPRGELKHLICVDVCPVKGIHHDPGKDRMLYIDPDGCISCGACFFECPVEAIYPVEDIPVQWVEYAELNREWFYGDKERVRKRVEEVAPAWLTSDGEVPGQSSDFSRSESCRPAMPLVVRFVSPL